MSGAIRGFKAEFSPEPTDFISAATIGRKSTAPMPNSAQSLRIGQRTPILGGVISAAQAELRHKSTDLIKKGATGRRLHRVQGKLLHAPADFTKADNIAWRSPRSQGGIPP